MCRDLASRFVSFNCVLALMVIANGCAAPPTISKTETAQPPPTLRATATLQPSPTLRETETLTPKPTATKTKRPWPTIVYPKACGTVTLGKPGTQSQDKTHRVLVQGTAILCNEFFTDENDVFYISIPRQEAQLDLDTGSPGTERTADLWLNVRGGSTIFRYLDSLNGALGVGLSSGWFYKTFLYEREPTFEECEDIGNLDYSESEPMYACVITNAGHISRIKVEQYSPVKDVNSLKISFITWDVVVNTPVP